MGNQLCRSAQDNDFPPAIILGTAAGRRLQHRFGCKPFHVSGADACFFRASHDKIGHVITANLVGKLLLIDRGRFIKGKPPLPGHLPLSSGRGRRKYHELTRNFSQSRDVKPMFFDRKGAVGVLCPSYRSIGSRTQRPRGLRRLTAESLWPYSTGKEHRFRQLARRCGAKARRKRLGRNFQTMLCFEIQPRLNKFRYPEKAVAVR